METMGTLYNCLREVRLEKYYPAFCANGITSYESLAELSNTELCAMGISVPEDRRRLLELVSIVKTVNRENSTSGAISTTTITFSAPLPRKRQPGSPTPSNSSSARSALSAAIARSTLASSSTSAGSQSEKKVPRRRPPPPLARNSPTFSSGGGSGGGGGGGSAVGGAVGGGAGLRLEPTRDVSVRERGPNFSVGSYLEMLEFMSDSSGHSTDPGDLLNTSSDSGGGNAGAGAGIRDGLTPALTTHHHHSHHHHPHNNHQLRVHVSASASSRNPASPARKPERVVRSQARSKGYNYGVPGGRESSARQRVRGSGSGGGSGGAAGGGGGRRVMVAKDERIRVCVRKRPVSRRESQAADADIVEVESTTTVGVKEPKVAVDLTAFTLKHEFVFDEVFDEACSNEDVYIRAARPLIATVFQRSNATFFAYGQTGAGKTHTMIGDTGVPGLYQLAAQDVFDIIASGQHGTDLHVWVSFFEIYCGQLFDLLNRRNRMVAREDGTQRVCIAGLTETEVPDVQTLIRVLQFGNSVRSKGTSGVNPDSSRSHAVLQMEIRSADDSILGKISFIDLAGSERASDMGDPDRQTRMEGAEINQSLLALKECIRSIDQESRHTPFRQSKLTHILKDAFVGNSRTCMITCLSPVQSSCEHTLNTLRYAYRVKEMKKDSGMDRRGEKGERGGGSTSFGQAMNLLMNIPITAPTIFHPSNLLSTSTPVRPLLHHHHPPHSPSSPSAAETGGDLTLDPSETPIRGHHVFSKPAAMVSKTRASSRPQTEKIPASSSHRPLRPVKGGVNSRGSYSAGAGASQGVLPPHPEASPSESDQTDTDSNNVTHPTSSEGRPQASGARPKIYNAGVVGSTDTEFDFPTSDFNVYDDDLSQKRSTPPQLNDLSSQGGRNDLSGVKARRAAPEVKDGGGGEQASAAASGPMRAAQSAWDRGASNPSPTNQLSGRSTKGQSSHRESPLLAGRLHRSSSSPPPLPPPSPSSSVKSSSGSTLNTKAGGQSEAANMSPASAKGSADSFDDELLFGEGQPSSASPAGRGSSDSNRGSSRQAMKVLPGLQTAVSSDLASFSQRSPLRMEKVAVNPSQVLGCQSPLSHRHSPTPSSPSPRHHEETSVRGGGGAYRLPVQHGERTTTATPTTSILPSRRDLVSQKTDSETGSARSVKQRTDKPGDNAGNLPFSTYSVSDPTLQSRSPSDPTIRSRTPSDPTLRSGTPSGRFAGEAWDASRPGLPSSNELSGPSSDPLSSMQVSTGVSTAPTVHSARDARPSSASLASHPGRHNAAGETRRNLVWTDSNSATLSSGGGSSSVVRRVSSASSALVTEKLMSGSVFSPIHPQPPSNSGAAQPPSVTRAGPTLNSCSGGNGGIVHPTPMVCGALSSVSMSSKVSGSSVISGSSMASGTLVAASLGTISSASFSVADRDQARVSLVGSHEDQLAAITSLCKQEMKLLLSAKKAVPRSFEDYLNRVGAILSQKMAAIQQLQQSISHYQTRFSTRPHTPSSSSTHPTHPHLFPASSSASTVGGAAISGDGGDSGGGGSGAHFPGHS